MAKTASMGVWTDGTRRNPCFLYLSDSRDNQVHHPKEPDVTRSEAHPVHSLVCPTSSLIVNKGKASSPRVFDQRQQQLLSAGRQGLHHLWRL